MTTHKLKIPEIWLVRTFTGLWKRFRFEKRFSRLMWKDVKVMYLSGLFDCFLRVCLDFITGVICDLGDGLFKDGRCLPNRQGRVQIRFTLENHQQETFLFLSLQEFYKSSEAFCLKMQKTDDCMKRIRVNCSEHQKVPHLTCPSAFTLLWLLSFRIRCLFLFSLLISIFPVRKSKELRSMEFPR